MQERVYPGIWNNYIIFAQKYYNFTTFSIPLLYTTCVSKNSIFLDMWFFYLFWYKVYAEPAIYTKNLIEIYRHLLSKICTLAFKVFQQILIYQEIQIQIAFCYIIFDSFNFSWVVKDFFNKPDYNFDDVSKNGYPRPS